MQTQFILVQTLPVPTSSPQATHFRFSTISVNPLESLNTHWDPSPLCSRFSKRQSVSWLQFSQSKRQPVSWWQLTFWDEQKDFSPLECMIQIEVPRGISLF